MALNYDHLSDIHLDVLREIGNIGAGNAATSLSVLLGQEVNMTYPKVNLLPFNDVPKALGGPEALTYGVLVTLDGDIDGLIMFLLNTQFAHKILSTLLGKEYDDLQDVDALSRSTIQEVGNILAGSYINSLAQLTELRVDQSVPSVTIDMVGALMNVPIVQFGSVGDRVLFIEETFGSGEASVVSHMVLFAQIESLNLILKKLGIM